MNQYKQAHKNRFSWSDNKSITFLCVCVRVCVCVCVCLGTIFFLANYIHQPYQHMEGKMRLLMDERLANFTAQPSDTINVNIPHCHKLLVHK